MRRLFTCLALFATVTLVPLHVSAQTAALLAVGDATQVSELQLAKVMADDSSLWLSVRLHGRSRLALVTAESGVESAPAADAWLRALDFATRMRVAAPPGPLTGCGELTQFELADSGLPEPQRVAVLEVSSVGSEVELRRRLADAGLPLEVTRVAQFTTQVEPPFRVAIYDVPELGGSTEALRLVDAGHPTQLPRIVISGAESLPLSLIALAKEGVRPLEQASADPSEFPVAYRALDADSDYLSARKGWLAQNPTRWLNEAQASAGLFAANVLSEGGQIESVVSRYFAALPGAAACAAQIRAARARASMNAADFACENADDLSRSLTEVGFAELRLSRLFGTVSLDGGSFQVAPSVARSPLLVATDFDTSGCPILTPPATPSEGSDSRTPPRVSVPPSEVSTPDDPHDGPTEAASTGTYSEGSCSVFIADSGSNDSCSGDSSASDSSSDSCSGDSSASDSSSDSCSGDSSASDSSSDSCSGDSSSDDSGPDSCSGDTSDSSSDSCSGDSDSGSDSSGCGKSEYDGDTCSGNSSSASGARPKSAGLRSARASAHPRPRQVRLSLLTLLAAALALPLRRLRASR
ncbi:MAG TPA: hypothetical protein VGC79_10925 [Polyangiaceae bacterium]